MIFLIHQESRHFFCRVWFTHTHTHLIKTMEKSKENSGVLPLFFHGKFAFSQYNLVGGTLGKLLENPATVSCFL